MSRFVNPNDLHKIDLGDDEWVEVPKKLSYGMISDLGDIDSSNSEKTTKLLLTVIKSWNLKNDKGTVLPVNEANIKMLDIPTVTEISDYIATMIDLGKKKSVG